VALDSVGQNLLHALEWEIHDFRVADTKARWDLDPSETVAAEKWMVNRIEDLKSLYRYDIDDQEQITVFLSKHNNADEFVATYKVIEDEPCL